MLECGVGVECRAVFGGGGGDVGCRFGSAGEEGWGDGMERAMVGEVRRREGRSDGE